MGEKVTVTASTQYKEEMMWRFIGDKNSFNPGTKKSAQKIAQKSPTAAQPEPEYKCAECGKPFTAFPERNLTAKQVYETCMNLSGGKRALCKACREKSNLQ